MHQIGVGVLGPVFRTYEPSEDRLVAVKAFHLDLTPEQAQALVDALGEVVRVRLAHRAIVSPIAAGLEDGVPYLAQEYVAAESLDVAMRHSAPAAPETALPLITQLGEAIDAAHERGIVHGALHLRDIFVTPDEARATGFGVVKALDEVGLRGPIRRPYTAPEVISGRPWGPEADGFALAAIAYELLTGKRAAGTGEQVTGRLDTVAEVDDREALRAVFATALGDSPETRYASATGFVVGLRTAIIGRGLGGGSATARAAEGMSDLLAGLDLQPHTPDPDQERAEAAHEAADGRHDLETVLGVEPEFPAEPDVVEGDEDTDDTLVASAGETQAPEAADLRALDRTLEQIEPLDAAVADSMLLGGDVEDEVPQVVDHGPAQAAHPPEEPPLPLEDGPARSPDASVVSARPMSPAADEPDDGATAFDADDAPVQPVPAVPGVLDESGKPVLGALLAADDVRPDETSSWSPRAVVPIAVAIAVATLAAYVIALGLGSRDVSLTPKPATPRGDQVLKSSVDGSNDTTREWSEATVGRETAARAADVPTPLGAPPDAQAEPVVRTRPAAPPPGISPPRESEVRAEPEPTLHPEDPAIAVTPPPPTEARPDDEPAVPAGSGWLLVRTNPPGASVTIDGQDRGETPLSLQNVAFGSHHVEVRYDGYESVSRDVRLTADAAVAAVSVDLGPASAPSPPPDARTAARGLAGSLYVDSRPSGARVLLDDQLVGMTPILVPDVTAGGHRVRIERDGYQSWVTTVDVPPSERVRVAASLDRLPRR